jgi:predicted metalloprotease with PDZ domain
MRILSCFLLLMVTAVSAQRVAYRVSFPNAVHHEAHIELTVSGIGNQPAVFRMSRSSPGRYATHEFGKNVYDVIAKDASGKPLTVRRTDGDVYEVAAHGNSITLSYTLFGNYADGTYAGIDPESIHLNMPAAFMWMKGLDNAPIEISFDIPKENKGFIATQLPPVPGKPNTFSAPGLQYFMDSPTKIGDLRFREWTISNPDGRTFKMRIALESDATEAQFDELAERVKKITAEARAVFGEYPNYDYGMYTFIASVNPYVSGDGMEHRNSTMITVPLQSFNVDFIQDVFSHEYFHNWNVERIRPKTLEPFNFEKSNMSHELWFAEGFTQYYGDLLLARAGITNESRYTGALSGLINLKNNTPGGKYYSPVEASNHAVFVDAAVSIDKNNYANMFSSYYPYGAAIALALDLNLQTKYRKTLDVFMQAMWNRFGKKEIPYTLGTMEEVLASVTDVAFAKDFFSKYIHGHEAIDYASLLAAAGYNLKKTAEGRAATGITPRSESGKVMIGSSTTKGSAAYEAGLDTGDELLKADDTQIKSTADLNNYLQQKKPGDVITIAYKHRNKEKTTQLTLKEVVSLGIVPFERDGKSVSEQAQQIRKSWFQSHVK